MKKSIYKNNKDHFSGVKVVVVIVVVVGVAVIDVDVLMGFWFTEAPEWGAVFLEGNDPSPAHFIKSGNSRTGRLRDMAFTLKFRSVVNKTTSLNRLSLSPISPKELMFLG